MKFWMIPLLFLLTIFVLGIFMQTCFAQVPLGPLGLPWIGSSFYSPFYSPFLPFGGPYLPTLNIFPPFYGGSFGLGTPFGPLTSPVPVQLSPFQRRPNATIIFTSPTLTAVTAAPGVIIVGATGVLGAPTVVVPTTVAASVPTALAAPAPSPLFSLLAVLYASAGLHGASFLSTANPLLFAYLTTLVL